MIVQFKDEFLEVLKEYGTGIRITTAFVNGGYKKFESLWNGETLTFTLDGEGEEGPIVVYYSDYNDNKIGKAFILGAYPAADAPEREKLYVRGEYEEREGGNYVGGIKYEGKEASPTGLYLVTKSVRDGVPALVGSAVEDMEDEELILTTTNYFNVRFPGDVKANVLSTYTDSTIKFLEDPYQIEGCNIFKCDSEIPTRESYEKHYRRQMLSQNTIPTYIDERGEKVRSSVLYKDYKSITIQAVDTPYSDDIYYIENEKDVTISGTCVYDVYRVENGSYTLIKENEVGGIDSTVLQCISGSEGSYSISNKVVHFEITSDIEKSKFRAYIKFQDELGDGSIKTVYSNVITFVTYLGWSVEYSSNFKDEATGNIVFLLDSHAGAGNLLGGDAKLTLYSDADIDVKDISVICDVGEYFNFEVKKEDSASERNKYTVKITTRQNTEENGKWFPIDSTGNSALLPCVLSVSGSSNNIIFYCVQRAKYPLSVTGNPEIEGYGAKITEDLTVNGQEIGDDYSGWDYEIEGTDTLVELVSGKKVGNNVRIISRKNPYAPHDKVKFFRVGPSGEVIQDSWKDVMYCYDDNSFTLDVAVDGESLGDNTHFYNNRDLFIFKRGDYTPQYFEIDEKPEKIPENDYFEFKWFKGDTETRDKIRIIPKEVTTSIVTDWYPKDKETGNPVMLTIGEVEFYCVVGPDLNDTVVFLDSKEQEIKEVKYEGENLSKEVIPVSTVSSEFDYWRSIGLDSRVSTFFSKYTNGYGVPFGNSVSLETQYQVTNSRDVKFEPLVLQRMAGRYTSAYDYFADWKNQLVSDYTATLPISIVGKDPSEILEVSVYNPDGTMQTLKDDEFLELDYIGLYKLFIKSTTPYRISIKGVEEGNQYFYFFNTVTDSIRDGILSIDKGSLDVVSGEETCFAFYGGEPGCFTMDEQILDTYIQVEDLSGGETVNIRLKRTYPDNNLSKVSPTGTDIFIKAEELKSTIEFGSNVEASVGEPIFSNSSFSGQGTITRRLVTTDMWTRGYEGHEYEYITDAEPPERYPIEPIDVLSIINPGQYNEESLEYNIYKLPLDPGFTVSKNNIELSYLGGSTGKINVKVREDAEYYVYYTPVGGEKKELTNRSGSFAYEDEKIKIYKNTGEDTWHAEEITGENYGDEDTAANDIYGTITFKSYVPARSFIKDRVYSQSNVDALVPGVEKEVAVVRMCMKNSTSSIIGSTTIIKKEGETRTYEGNFISGETINAGLALDEQSNFLEGLTVSEDKNITVTFRDRPTANGYSGIGISKFSISSILKMSKEEEDRSFYVYEGNKKVYFNGLKQEKWERGIRVSGSYGEIATRNYSGTIFVGDSQLSTTYLDYDETSFTIYVCSVELDESLQMAHERCNVSLAGTPANHTGLNLVDTLNLSSTSFGYPVRIKLPENDSYENTAGPYTLTISDDYGNKITKTYYVKPNNTFNVFLVDEEGLESGTKLSETAFSSGGVNLHPSDLYILTDAPYDSSVSFSVSSSYTRTRPAGTSSNSLLSTFSIDSSTKKLVTFDGEEYTAYKVGSFTSRISGYYAYGSFNPVTSGFGHLEFDSTLSIRMYCNGGYSYTPTITGHHGYTEAELIGPYKTYFYDNAQGVDFNSQESPEETSKYSTSGSYFMSNVKISVSSNYYRVDNQMYVVYNEKDPKKYDTEERPFNTYGYYAGFKLRITRKEYVYTNGTWKLSEKKKHTIKSPESLILIPDTTIVIKDDDGNDLVVPSYIMAPSGDTRVVAPDGSGAGASNGSVTIVEGYDAGLLYVIPAESFTKSSSKNSCTKTFTVSSEGINDQIKFTVNFDIYL